MESKDFEKHIHVLEGDINKYSVIHNVVERNLHRDPFFICDLGEIVRRYNEWKFLLPRVKPYYAVKCNDHSRVLELMAALGMNFDCASKLEIDKILNMGLKPNRIIYANPVKQISHLQHASARNVDLHTVDNETELYKYKKYYPTARLLLRISCDDPDSLLKFGLKFGCDYLDEAPHLLQIAKKLDLNVIGVCFHIGSGVLTPNIYHTAISYASNVFNYAKTLDYHFSLLDIGGGMRGKRTDSLEKSASIINKALEEFFPDPKVEIISEPGQYFVDAAFTLVCNIISKRKIHISDNTTTSGIKVLHNMYYINDGVFSSFNKIVWNLWESKPISLTKNTGQMFRSDIWGQTCYPRDIVSRNVLLPEMKEGDWVIYEEIGAYSYSTSTKFNGFPETKAYNIINKSLWLALKDKSPFTEDDFILDHNLTTVTL